MPTLLLQIAEIASEGSLYELLLTIRELGRDGGQKHTDVCISGSASCSAGRSGPQ